MSNTADKPTKASTPETNNSVTLSTTASLKGGYMLNYGQIKIVFNKAIESGENVDFYYGKFKIASMPKTVISGEQLDSLKKGLLF